MADLETKISPIIKGMKLDVTVEEAVNDILLVCLNYGSTIYRGVLMDIKQRSLPSGISFPKLPQKPDPGGKINVNTPESGKDETESPGVCLSATSYRHSYTKDPVEFASKPLQLPSSSIIGRKTVRNITLRPRKTLCTNCKSNIHDTKLKHGIHGHSKLSQSHSARSPLSRSTRLHPNALSPPLQLSKRTLSTDDESASKSPIQKKVGRLNLSPRLITNKSSFTNRASKPFSRCLAGRKKSTPAIKISIGGDSVLNIPPRISGNETPFKSELSDSNRSIIKKELTVRLTDIAQQANQYAALKKVKKCVKKSKEREEEECDVPINVTQKSEIDSKPFDPTKLTWHVSSHPKKHKRKHKHRHSSGDGDKNNSNLCSTDWQESEAWLPVPEMQSPILDNFQMDSPAYQDYKARSPVSSELKTESPRAQEFLDEISENFDEDNENNVPVSDDSVTNRPRLVYTWKQNHGLSRVETKFTGMKDYPLRSKEKESDKYLSPRNDGNVTSYSDGEDSSVTERSDSDELSDSQTSDSDGFLSPASPDKNSHRFKPLMMKIQNLNVNKCVTTDGRKLHVNDIIWGKIQGFPWWPGRVMSITMTKRDNGLIIAQLAHIAWFGSSTRSHMPCDEIFPFLEDFKMRYNKKKRGPYKLAIRQATTAAGRTPDDVNLEIQHVEN